MATILFKNNARATLSAGITAIQTTLPLATGTGALFPSPTGGDYFLVTLQNVAGNIEICKCTSRAGDVLTVVRAQEGTAGFAFASGDKCENRLTAGSLSLFINAGGGTITGSLTINTDFTVLGNISLGAAGKVLTIGADTGVLPAGGISFSGGGINFPSITQGGNAVVDVLSVQTLANKTLTLPQIATITPDGAHTLTLPAATDQLVGRATADTLTNKTISAANAASTIDDGTGTGPFRIGFRDVPLNPQNGAYHLAASDAGKAVYSQNTGAQTITVDAHATTAIGNGAVIGIVNDGTTAISVTPAAGVTLVFAGASGITGARTINAGGMAWLWQVSIDRWFVSGPGVS
ncbi:MAG: hypothetical protein ACXWCO_00740 [Caldimonas sp.]